MNFKGHIKFALGVGLVAVYFLQNHITINARAILFYLPFYLCGTIIVDKIERPTSVHHRSFLHSRRVLLLSIALIPFLYWKMMNSPFLVWWIFTYSYWGMGLAGILGHSVHLIGDSLTGRLPR